MPAVAYIYVIPIWIVLAALVCMVVLVGLLAWLFSHQED
jgi:hypothetical protein